MIDQGSPAPVKSLSLQEFEYEIIELPRGTLRRFVYQNGDRFEEYTSHASFAGLPLYHRTSGRMPETGRSKTAQGVIAIGRKACGILAIGQMAFGVVTIGQLSVGMLFGIGQAATGMIAIGQLGIAGLFSLSQIGLASRVIAQVGLGRYVLAQIGYGEHVWDMRNGVDPQVQQEFSWLLDLF